MQFNILGYFYSDNGYTTTIESSMGTIKTIALLVFGIYAVRTIYRVLKEEPGTGVGLGIVAMILFIFFLILDISSLVTQKDINGNKFMAPDIREYRSRLVFDSILAISTLLFIRYNKKRYQISDNTNMNENPEI